VDIATANDFVLFSFSQQDISREMLVCVCVAIFLCTLLWCSGDPYIPKHRAKAMTRQAVSVSFNMFIVLKQDRNEILRNDIEQYREKYIALNYFEVKISKKNIDRSGNELDW